MSSAPDKKSLYAEYVTERTKDLVLETINGFVLYRYLNDCQVYIVDVYVKPEFRKAGIASEMVGEIAAEAKAVGCTEMIVTVVPSTHGSTTSLKVVLAYGFQLLSATQDLIIFKKEL